LEISPANHAEHLSAHGVSFFEVILTPHSMAEGKTLKEIDFRQHFNLTVIALKRLTRSFRTDVGDIPLAFGDSLLVIGPTSKVQSLRKSSDFIVIEPNPADKPVNIRQALLIGAITLGAIGASIAGAPIYLCMLGGAALAVLLNILTMEEAFQSIEWQAIFLIAGMYAVSLAMVQTGLADLLGRGMIAVARPLGPLGIASGAYLLTALLTQVMGGQVTALVTGPVTISAALSIGANPHAVAVATAIGCSASFLTPMAHPVNILMIAPANYKFSDFFRAGWLLTIVSFITLLIGLSIFWHL
jgi:di/tricarboxylate transporter